VGRAIVGPTVSFPRVVVGETIVVVQAVAVLEFLVLPLGAVAAAAAVGAIP